jgi:D-alanyl-D-alanine dipeptidase
MAPNEILFISDPRILKVQIQDNGDKLVDIKDFKELLVDKRESNSSKSFSLLRNSVVLKLLEVQKDLPPHLRLLLIEGHRPVSTQEKNFKEYSNGLKKLHPEWTENQIYKEASRYVAPPDIIPPHSTGGAVDLTIINEEGKEIDMGTRVNADPEESQNACFTLAENISEQAKKNRLLGDFLIYFNYIHN